MDSSGNESVQVSLKKIMTMTTIKIMTLTIIMVMIINIINAKYLCMQCIVLG